MNADNLGHGMARQEVIDPNCTLRSTENKLRNHKTFHEGKEIDSFLFQHSTINAGALHISNDMYEDEC